MAQARANSFPGTGQEGKNRAEGIGIDFLLPAVVFIRFLVVCGNVVVVIVLVVSFRRLISGAGSLCKGRFLFGNIHRRSRLRGRFLCRLRNALVAGLGGLNRFASGNGLARRAIGNGNLGRILGLRGCRRGFFLYRRFRACFFRSWRDALLRVPAAKALMLFNEPLVIQIGAIVPAACHSKDRLSFRPATRGSVRRARTAVGGGAAGIHILYYITFCQHGKTTDLRLGENIKKSSPCVGEKGQIRGCFGKKWMSKAKICRVLRRDAGRRAPAIARTAPRGRFATFSGGEERFQKTTSCAVACCFAESAGNPRKGEAVQNSWNFAFSHLGAIAARQITHFKAQRLAGHLPPLSTPDAELFHRPDEPRIPSPARAYPRKRRCRVCCAMITDGR